MQTPEVEREIERSTHSEPGDVSGQERTGDAGVLRAPACLGDRAVREIHTHRVPAMAREIHDVRARSAAEVERASRRMRSYEPFQLGRRYPCVPATFARQPVPRAEQEPAHGPRLERGHIAHRYASDRTIRLPTH